MSSFIISYDLISDKDYSSLYEAIRNYCSYALILVDDVEDLIIQTDYNI